MGRKELRKSMAMDKKQIIPFFPARIFKDAKTPQECAVAGNRWVDVIASSYNITTATVPVRRAYYAMLINLLDVAKGKIHAKEETIQQLIKRDLAEQEAEHLREEVLQELIAANIGEVQNEKAE